jgi:hypothetical protein
MNKIRIEILVPEDEWNKALEMAKKHKKSLKKELTLFLSNYSKGFSPILWSKEGDRKKRETTWFKELIGKDDPDHELSKYMDGKKWVTKNDFWKTIESFFG